MCYPFPCLSDIFQIKQVKESVLCLTLTNVDAFKIRAGLANLQYIAQNFGDTLTVCGQSTRVLSAKDLYPWAESKK